MASDTLVYIFGIIVIAAVFGFICWLVIKWKLRKINKKIPQASLDELAKAEQMFIDGKGKLSQQDVLYALAKEHTVKQFNLNNDKEVNDGRQKPTTTFSGTDKSNDSGVSTTQIRENINDRNIIPSGRVEQPTENSEQSGENNQRDKPNPRKFRKLPRI